MEKKEMRVSARERLYSLDALRGLDMFILVGGASLIVSLVQVTGIDAEPLRVNLKEHVDWVGFRIHDLIFPLFMFVSGVAIPYSIQSKLEKNVPKNELMLKAFKRMVILILLGILYNGGFRTGLANARIASVLGQIGIAYFFATLITMQTTTIRSRLIWLVSILTGVGIIQLFVPVPGVGAGVLTPEGCINGYIDRHLLPGRLHKELFDPEGILCNISAIGITLMGAIAGSILRLQKWNNYKKLGILGIAGILSIALALLLSPYYPMIKKCWTSTFNLLAGGTSVLLLAFLYLIIDHWKIRGWAYPFRLFGMNALFVYLLVHFISVGDINKEFFGWIARALGEYGDLFNQFSKLGLICLLLYYMYKKRIFFRA
jgi:predicted acyltransferase